MQKQGVNSGLHLVNLHTAGDTSGSYMYGPKEVLILMLA